MGGPLLDPRASYTDDGEVLFAVGVSASAGGPSCFVVARTERMAGTGVVTATRRMVAAFRDPADAFAVASTLDAVRNPIVYVRTPGGAWLMLVPIDIDGGKLAERRVKATGVRAKPTRAQQVPGRWLGRGVKAEG